MQVIPTSVLPVDPADAGLAQLPQTVPECHAVIALLIAMENNPTLWVVSVALNGALYFVVGQVVARARRASITGSAPTS